MRLATKACYLLYRGRFIAIPLLDMVCQVADSVKGKRKDRENILWKTHPTQVSLILAAKWSKVGGLLNT